jgi:hypothetical protein
MYFRIFYQIFTTLFLFYCSFNQNLNQHLCGGALVLNFTVVTSANCLLKDNGEFYDASELNIVLGTFSIKNVLTSNPTTYEVSKVIIHGRFNRRTLANNVAVIRVSWVF